MKAITCAVLLTCLIASTATAAPVFFSDRSSFLAAAGGSLNLENFEADHDITSPITFGGFTVSESNGLDLLAQARNYSFTQTFITLGTGALWFDDNDSSIGTFYNFVSPVNAFGLNVTTDVDSTVRIGGSVQSSLELFANMPVFWGVIDTNGLSSISFDPSGGPNIGFDYVQYGGAEAPAVPEPSTMLLLGGGLAGLAILRRKTRRS